MSIQMMARPLMTPAEIKRIKKGDLLIMKTGTNPMKVKIPFYKSWGIEFNDDFEAVSKDIRIPNYISINELKEKIVESVLSVEPIISSENRSKKIVFEKIKK